MPQPHKYIKKIEELKAKLWPDIGPDELWNRNQQDGFFTLPRTMPLIMSIIDDLSKGAPASAVYLELWARNHDQMYVSLGKSNEMAFHSGFNGQRAVRAWQERIKKLSELGFIRLAQGTSGALSHALILNPHIVIERLHRANYPGLLLTKYNALLERGVEIGADDIGFDPKIDLPKPIKPPKPRKVTVMPNLSHMVFQPITTAPPAPSSPPATAPQQHTGETKPTV